MKLTALVAVLGSAVALPASANYLLNAKVTCYDVANDKLVSNKPKSEDLIALCLGVAPTDPSVADFALTFDSDTRELHVVRRCINEPVQCQLSTQLSCDSAGQDFNVDGACVYQLLDNGAHDVQGTMLCKETERYSLKTHKYSFKAKCAGGFTLDGHSCSIAFTTGKALDDSSTCPAP